MTFFARLFRRPAPPVPVLADSAASAESSHLAAVGELPDGEKLRRAAGVAHGSDEEMSTAVPSAVRRAAQARLAHLIDVRSIDFARFCLETAHQPASMSVIALCSDTTRLPQLLASLDDAAQLARLVVDSQSSRVRQCAAEAIDDSTQLRQLLRQVRGKDKNVYRILKQKCDAWNARERRAAEIASGIAALCAALERHSQRSFDANYTARLNQLEHQWQTLTSLPDAATERRARLAIDAGREVVASHLRRIAEQAVHSAAQQTEQEARERQRHEDQARAAAEATAQAEMEVQARREAAAEREAQATVRAAKRAAEDEVFRQIAGLIRQANAALDDGSTQRAAGLRRTLESRLPSEFALPPALAHRLRKLDDKLNHLKEWKDYAVAPKRLELIQEMEMLVGASEDPTTLADRIKALQQEWGTISKGIVSETPAEWERFHQAAQSAYQPCREYFDAQAALRRENLENRRLVLARLHAVETALQGEHWDWRLAASVLREAPQEWRCHFPVERSANRSIQKEFDAALERLRFTLDVWFARNVADRRTLIARARQLLAQEDSREAIEAVQRLQRVWKETGPAPRDLTHLLWGEFRDVCDAVYEKREQAYVEYKVGLEANKTAAMSLCEEAELMGTASGSALLAAETQFAAWRAAFEALGELPRADARSVHDRLERAIEACQGRIATRLERDARRALTDLLTAGDLIQAYQWSVLANADPAEQATLKAAANDFIAGVKLWPKDALPVIVERMGHAETLCAADGAAREKALRLVCIRCEIAHEIPAAPQDEALRREYQIQRLVQSMTHGRNNGSRGDTADAAAAVLDWVRIGVITPAVYGELRARFGRCWDVC